jgi:predicted acyl esterase
MSDRRLRVALKATVVQTVDLANRADIDRVVPGGGIVSSEIDTVDAVRLVSEPLPVRTELSGLFSGSLDLAANKKDFDVYVALYELNAKGEYFLLSTWQMRASHAGDLTRRRLLTPGERTRLDFTSIRLTSRLLERGSRIVALVGPLKAPVFQINLGSGKDVSDETVADAGPPLTIKWFSDSFLEIPVRGYR